MSTTGHPIVVVLPNVRQPIPVVALFRALGCEPARDILEHVILRDIGKAESMTENVAELLQWMEPSMNEGFAIQDQQVALSFIGTRSLKPGVSLKERIAFAKNLLRENVFPHVGTTDDYNQAKVFFLGHMVSRLLAIALGNRDPDDRDHYGNKRLDLAGPLMLNQFRQCFFKMCGELRARVQKLVNRNQKIELKAVLRGQTISDGLKYFLSTGNGASRIQGGRIGLAQVLNRLTYCATLSHLRRVNTPINQEARLAAPRLLHNTQWGVVCPAETPEGQACGLVKNLALMAYITVGVTATAIREMLEHWDFEDIRALHPTDVQT